MAATFFLLFVSTPRLPLGATGRVIGLTAALTAGIACDSKSFLFALPFAVVLAVVAKRDKSRAASYALLSTLVVTAVLIWITSYEPGSDPLYTLKQTDTTATGLTGGRLGETEWTVFDPLIKVLNESPLLGYGLAERPGIYYSDSALNSFVLHGGLVGLVVVSIALVLQWRWFRLGDQESGWEALATRVFVTGIAYFSAGAIFMMNKTNDLLFTMIGIGVAMRPIPRAVATSGPPRGLLSERLA